MKLAGKNLETYQNYDQYIFGCFDNSNGEIGTIKVDINTVGKTAFHDYLIGAKEYWGNGACVRV